MQNEVVLLSIMVKDFESTPAINEILHKGREMITGRMGLPNVKEGISVICIVMDATSEAAKKMTDELSKLNGVCVNCICSG